MQETKKSTFDAAIFTIPFVVLGHMFKYAGVGIRTCFYDFWVTLFTGASYQVDKTYQKTKNPSNTIIECIIKKFITRD